MLNNTGASFGPSPPGDGTAATLPGLNANMLTPSPAKEDYHELLDISGLQMVDGHFIIPEEAAAVVPIEVRHARAMMHLNTDGDADRPLSTLIVGGGGNDVDVDVDASFMTNFSRPNSTRPFMNSPSHGGYRDIAPTQQEPQLLDICAPLRWRAALTSITPETGRLSAEDIAIMEKAANSCQSPPAAQGLAGRRVASVTSLAVPTPTTAARATSRASTASPGSGKVLLTDV